MNLRKAAKAAPKYACISQMHADLLLSVTCVAGTVNGLIEKDGVIKGVTYSVKAGADSRETKVHLITVYDDASDA